MRLVLINVFLVTLLILFTQAGEGISGNFLVSTAYAQTPIVCNVVIEDEDEETLKFWEEFFKGHLDDEDTDEEQDDDEKDEPAEENENDDNESDDEDEWDPDEQGLLDFLNQGKIFEEDDDDEIINSSPPEEESSDNITDDEFQPPPEDMYDDESWSQIPGVKVPFFFLLDEYASEMDEYLEPKIAHLKALKYADQIINGINFKYNVDSSSVYLAENMVEIPEYIYMVDRFDYAGVSKFNYEVSVNSDLIDLDRPGRIVSVAAQVRSTNIAASFEASRKRAFIDAVRKAYVKEKFVKNSNKKTEYTGKIFAWKVLDEGWKPNEDVFFLRMRVWVSFDKT